MVIPVVRVIFSEVSRPCGDWTGEQSDDSGEAGQAAKVAFSMWDEKQV